jgi:hypothetical protein
MRRKALLFISIGALAIWQTLAHGGDHSVDVNLSDQPLASAPHPSNGTSVAPNPAIDHRPAENEPSPPPMDMDMEMDMGDMNHHPAHDHPVVDGPIPPEQMSYWLWPEHRGLLYGHILIMVFSWAFLLPLGRFENYGNG